MALKGVTLLTSFRIDENMISGTWPDTMSDHMAGLTKLSIYKNRISGAWPDGALNNAPALRQFAIFQNRIAGTWPDMALEKVTQLEFFLISSNPIVGSFCSEQLHASRSSIIFVDVMRTDVEGSLPHEWTAFQQMEHLRAGRTLMEGALPPLAAGNSQSQLSFVSLVGLHLEGLIPPSLGRMQVMNASIVLGFGHTGRMPVVSGTLLMLSIFRSSVHGHMPKLHLATWSILLLHANHLSCQLPAFEDNNVRPMLSIAILGNRFKKPRRLSFPAWIQSFERGEHLVVTNEHWVTLLLQLLGGSCALLALARHCEAWSGIAKAVFVLHPPRLFGKSSQLRSLVHSSCRAHVWILFFACFSVLTYLSGHTHACLTVLMRLCFPVLTTSSHAFTTLLEVFVASCILQTYRSLLVLSHSGPPRKVRKKARQPPRDKPKGTKDGVNAHHVAGAWVMWLLLCCCISSPGAIYAMLRTVPGFLKSSELITRLITCSVSLCTCFLVVVCLPVLAAALQKRCTSLSQQELLSVANLSSFPVLPNLISYICHAQCCGQWAKFWEPCVHQPSSLDAMEHVQLPYFPGSFDVRSRQEDSFFQEALLKRRDVCGNGRMSLGRCLDAMLDSTARVLLSTAFHLTFTSSIGCLVQRRQMQMSMAWLHVVRVWGLVVIFGSSVPLLLAITAINFIVHTWLLFGKPALLKEDDDSIAKPSGPALPLTSVRAAALYSCIFQLLLVFNATWQ